MVKPNRFVIELVCDYSTRPGPEDMKWVGFRPTRDGFSVWSGVDLWRERFKRRTRRNAVKTPLSWRTASEYLLADDGLRVGTEPNSKITVYGAFYCSRLGLDILKACWQADQRPEMLTGDELRFLLGLSDDDLEWLAKSLGARLNAEPSVKLLRRYLKRETHNPRLVWKSLVPRTRSVKFQPFLERIEAAPPVPSRA